MSKILIDLIIDGLSIFAAYSINFVACDILYHDFNLRQSFKGAYWFILGPALYILGPELEWLDAWIKAMIYKEKNAIKEKLESWLKNILPGPLVKPVSFITNNSLFTEENIDSQNENVNFLHDINRIN